jgi:hypothetical protein
VGVRDSTPPMGERAQVLEAARSFGERILRSLADPLAGARRQTELVRYYGGAPSAGLAPEVIERMDGPEAREKLRGLLMDYADLAEPALRLTPQVMGVDTAYVYAASASLGAIHGMIGSGWVTATVGGAAGLASLGLDGEYRPPMHGMFTAAASALMYRLFSAPDRRRPSAPAPSPPPDEEA